jgi:hypothetical protein
MFKKQGLAEVTFEVFPMTVTSYALARRILNLEKIVPEALAANLMTQNELHRLHASFEQAEAEGAFFGSTSIMLVSGRKTIGAG